MVHNQIIMQVLVVAEEVNLVKQHQVQEHQELQEVMVVMEQMYRQVFQLL